MEDTNWMQTYTGKKLHFLDPQPNEICLTDVAHALSNICRFTGHCSEFYSVAQHSVYVSVYVSRENALWGLLHDATEAYMYDLAKPIKICSQLDGYREIENKLQVAIAKAFGLSLPIPNEVKKVDKAMLVTEARDLGLLTPEWKDYGTPPLKLTVRPQLPSSARQSFLDWYEVITAQTYYKE